MAGGKKQVIKTKKKEKGGKDPVRVSVTRKGGDLTVQVEVDLRDLHGDRHDLHVLEDEDDGAG